MVRPAATSWATACGGLMEIDMNIAIGIAVGLAVAAGAFGLWVFVQYAKGMSR